MVVLTFVRYLSTYEPFKYLMSKSASLYVKNFIKRDRQLAEYELVIERFKKMASDAALLSVYVPMNVFLIDCSGINKVYLSTTEHSVTTEPSISILLSIHPIFVDLRQRDANRFKLNYLDFFLFCEFRGASFSSSSIIINIITSCSATQEQCHLWYTRFY